MWGMTLLLVFIVVAALVAFKGWLIMLLWGALAPLFGAATIGFGTAVLVGMALGVVGSYFRSPSRR